ncbi:MAG: PDZ domain-containing protein [Caldilineaceae bacterium]|nr:PDZ domain-containing protein [Caldilineaceae bacterium]
MIFRTFILYLSLVVCLMLAFVAGFLSYPTLHPLLVSQWVEVAPPVAEAQFIAPVADPMDMTVFWQVNDILERDFYGTKPDLQTRRYGAIQGLVGAFNDRYTRYEPPPQSADSQAAICGCDGVIGVTVDQTEAGFVLYPLPDLPAAQAGIIDGDILLQVDETVLTATLSVDEVMALVNGQPDTDVVIVVQRALASPTATRTQGEAVGEILNFQMRRVVVVTPSMEWRLLTEDSTTANIGYIRHFRFTEHSPEEMQRALDELAVQGADRFILDLRDNPGGPVDAALQITDMWLDQGVMLIEEESNGAEKQFEATAGQVITNAPLVIVVDQGTASASEIVAGALRDYQRATLVGTQTYGKGSVQLRHQLADQSSLFVTNALWFTPQRHQIADVGLAPDVVVDEQVDPLPVAIASVQQIVVAQR